MRFASIAQRGLGVIDGAAGLVSFFSAVLLLAYFAGEIIRAIVVGIAEFFRVAVQNSPDHPFYCIIGACVFWTIARSWLRKRKPHAR